MQALWHHVLLRAPVGMCSCIAALVAARGVARFALHCALEVQLTRAASPSPHLVRWLVCDLAARLLSYAIRISALAALAHLDLGPVYCTRLRCSRGRHRSMREARRSCLSRVGLVARRQRLHHVCQGSSPRRSGFESGLDARHAPWRGYGLGGANFEDATCWECSAHAEVAFEGDAPRSVKSSVDRDEGARSLGALLASSLQPL